MQSDDSEDEPLSILVEAKKQDPTAFLATTFTEDVEPAKTVKKKKKKTKFKRLPVTIELVPKAPPVIVRPEDVWMYLKDLNQSGPYSCLLCTEWFINKSKLIVHYILNHKKDFCGICRYFVPDQEAWIKHQEFHTPWGCSQCSETFNLEHDLRLHFNEHHNLVYCRLCYFLVSNGSPYEVHMKERHSVTNPSCKDEEFFWELDQQDISKFTCSLCQKADIPATNFFNHYFIVHRFTLKCFANIVSGRDIPFTISGAKISQKFYETLLSNHKNYGYANSTMPPENEIPYEVLIPEVKQELLSDNEEDPFAQISSEVEAPENQEQEKDQDETPHSYQGEMDFDITQTELLILQKCSQDYISHIQQELAENRVAELSEIDYKTELERQMNCTICSNHFKNVTAFASHMTKQHGIKPMPFFSCRICLSSFDSLSDLDEHKHAELDDFQDLWLCQFCDREFDGRVLTRRHLNEHFESLDVDNCFSPHLGFKCRYCPTLFWNEIAREKHQSMIHHNEHKEDFFKCDSCFEIFSDRVWFIHHYAIHSPIPFLLKCRICSLTLRSIDSAREHFRENHKKARKLYCSMSPCHFRPLSHRRNFETHMRATHGEPPNATPTGACVPCASCRRVFSSARAHAVHVAAVHGRTSGGFRCKLCGDALTTSDERKLHYMIRHPGRHPFQCATCGRSFPHKSSLYAHRAEHKGAAPAHTCSYCGKSFMKRDSYREHLAIHSAPRHACAYCPMRFVQRSNMLRHERTHTGERPYECHHCQRSFSDRGAAASHARTHTKDQHFDCMYCGKTFVQKSKLNYHIRKHTGENLVTCMTCKKLFTSGASLREHMKTHQPKPAVACALCDRKYHGERAMARHIRAAHGAPLATHPCPLCGRAFQDNASLRHHVVTHATDNMYRCIYCSKTYAARRSMVGHLPRRHRALPPVYRRLDVRDCGLKLDEVTTTKIFGPRQPPTDIAVSAKAGEVDQPVGQRGHGPIKAEANDGELEPTDFVSVKIEPDYSEEFSE